MLQVNEKHMFYIKDIFQATKYIHVGVQTRNTFHRKCQTDLCAIYDWIL